MKEEDSLNKVMSLDSIKKPKAYNGSKKYVFISYSHLDSELVYSDITKLQKKGLRIWYDEGLPAGVEWDKVVYPKIVSDQCSGVIFFVSPFFFSSKSIAKEIEIVFNLGGAELCAKQSFAVHIGGVSILEMMQESFNNPNQNILHENISIITSCFNEKRTFIKRGNNVTKSYYDHILSNALRYSAIDEENLEVLTNNEKSFKVLFIAKDSSFSKSILSGIREYYASVDTVNLSSVLVNQNDCRLADLQLIKLLDESEQDYDGIVLRPLFNISQNVKLKLEQLISSGKKVILVDKDLSNEQKKDFRVPIPLFVASDFSKGGEMLGETISHLTTMCSDSASSIILLDGPLNIPSAQARLSALKRVLQKNNKEVITTSIILDSFDSDSTLDMLETRFGEWIKSKTLNINKKTLFIFFGNDNIALSVSNKFYTDTKSNIHRYISSAKNVVFIGYDGIQGHDGKIAMSSMPSDFMTINVVPSIQGRETARLMYDYLTKPDVNKGVLIAPQLIKTITMEKQTIKSKYISQDVIKNMQLLIFDLDGTIANTEEFHWESYNIILKDHGIKLENTVINKYIGKTEKKIWRLISEDFHIEIDIAYMMKKRTQIVLELFEKNNLMPYKYFLKIIKESKGIPKIILSSQIPEVINYLIKRWELDCVFKSKDIISVSDGRLSKNEVLSHLNHYTVLKDNYSTYNVAIFEDSKNVLKYANELGIRTIGVEHEYNKGTLEDCNHIINDTVCNGLFIGLAGMDIVHYQNGSLPEENSKSKTNDFSARVGGPAANAAIVFASLGGNSTLITAIGDSVTGKSLKNMLVTYGVEVIDIRKNDIDSPNISSIIINTKNGNRTIISGQKMINFDDIDKKPSIPPMDFCLYDCNAPDIFQLFEKELEKVPVVLDAGSYKDHLKDHLHYADEVISSEQFRIDGKTVLDLKESYKWNFAAKTNGGNVVSYSDPNKEGNIIPPKVENVVDTLGAGDVLHGAYCYYRFVKNESYSKALEVSVKVASKSITYRGILDDI